mmetsp:Transcript_35982/g.103444  ORF Transcript_35982/g.103444 Transcript_35982/m.103444 type:complete len:308 (-) Transcript_35982:42-965(-)
MLGRQRWPGCHQQLRGEQLYGRVCQLPGGAHGAGPGVPRGDDVAAGTAVGDGRTGAKLRLHRRPHCLGRMGVGQEGLVLQQRRSCLWALQLLRAPGELGPTLVIRKAGLVLPAQGPGLPPEPRRSGRRRQAAAGAAAVVELPGEVLHGDGRGPRDQRLRRAERKLQADLAEHWRRDHPLGGGAKPVHRGRRPRDAPERRARLGRALRAGQPRPGVQYQHCHHEDPVEGTPAHVHGRHRSQDRGRHAAAALALPARGHGPGLRLADDPAEPAPGSTFGSAFGSTCGSDDPSDYDICARADYSLRLGAF